MLCRLVTTEESIEQRPAEVRDAQTERRGNAKAQGAQAWGLKSSQRANVGSRGQGEGKEEGSRSQTIRNSVGRARV